MDFYANTVRRMAVERYPARHLTQRIMRARRFIDRHYHQPIDLAAIAHQACLSQHHFIRCFRQHYGRTPHQYLRDVRMAHARQLMKEGWTVTSTCMAVGYKSPNSFSLLFRQVTGQAPSNYRKAIFDRQARSRAWTIILSPTAQGSAPCESD
ncbi:helix-turn-helix transcriptional regulator [Wenzhouxiangella sp. XN201]|uniref:AraC family transcriptional regulator n=1 Tax=Wenzhouxiangella sp. XN201 TaxID=2710755 RepID=UPI0013C81935|nr:AraC family transcriptional regulator [Wenzhouxiangella sp. XN201]NEZ04252.1 helix-turn-helix transcriptional regulator [Wenzhouxiangella sp. XN201]